MVVILVLDVKKVVIGFFVVGVYMDFMWAICFMVVILVLFMII